MISDAGEMWIVERLSDLDAQTRFNASCLFLYTSQGWKNACIAISVKAHLPRLTCRVSTTFR